VTPSDEPVAEGSRRRARRRGRLLIVAFVFAGGGMGTVARYAIETAWGPASASAFPVATLGINVAGAFAVGLLLTLILEYWPPTRYVRAFAAIGILGGFTTFSTFVVEADRLLGAGRIAAGLSYVVISVSAGIVACAAGAGAARAWPSLARRRAG